MARGRALRTSGVVAGYDVGDRREGKERKKRKVDYYFVFFILFQNPSKMPCPHFFTTPHKKENTFFRQLIGKKLTRLKKNI